ncbi:MAG: DUF1800 domain-containing protein [Comamonadaceae bacterium]|nr:MAG: DUF1800 domain-containing protein [Comamonadaceae bacterium]
MHPHSALTALRTAPQLTRRQWLALSAAGCVAGMGHAQAAPPGTPVSTQGDGDGDAAWSSATGAWRIRLLDRVTWGAQAGDLQALQSQGPAAFIAAQLRPASAALPPAAQAQIDAMAISRQPADALALQMTAEQQAAKALPTEDERKAALQTWQQAMRALQQEAARRHVLRALYSPAPLQEKMTWFWMNHFNVFAGKAELRALVGDYEETAIRPHALGRFRDLLGATVRHPAMLRYLDNAQNASGRINENYARELMELHTLGVDGGYSQQDVQELARVLTGHGISLRALDAPPPRLKPQWQAQYVRRGLYEFHPQRHDWGAKALLGAPLRQEGMAELDEALDRLARAPATARFIARKLALFFVGDAPPAPLVQALAAQFERSDGDIAAVLQTLFHHPALRDSLGTRFRDPVHYVLAALRAAYGAGGGEGAGDAVVPNPEPVLAWLQRLAEPLYGRATPDGYPLDSAAWTGSGQMTSRFEIARTLAAGAAPLFKPTADAADAADAATPAPRPVPPAIAQGLYFQALEPHLGAATRVALSKARSPAEWNTFLLASPEFLLA